MKIDRQKLNEYLAAVKHLPGTKIKIKSPIQRALYEEKSLDAKKWLSLKEFFEIMNWGN